MNQPFSTFEYNILNTFGDKGKAWLATLPQEIERWKRTWGLRDLQPYSELTYNYVMSGFQGDLPVVLKLCVESEHEEQALKAFAGYGTVALVEHDENALLLQRALSGVKLKNQPKAIEITCDVIKRLHQAPIPQPGKFPHMDTWLAALDKDWNIPHEQLHLARTYKKSLPPSSPSILLHGDLHQDNILSHGKEWLVIDPKGVIGHPLHELWACIEDLEHDIPFLATYFGYPRDQLIKCYYVHLILAACWCVEDNLEPTLFLDLARQTQKKWMP